MHLWIKYDAHAQLDKVKSVLEEIVRSCDRGPPAEVRKKPSATQAGNNSPGNEFPKNLPAKPTRPPASPLECFFTLHFIAHAIPGLTTAHFEATYHKFFGYPLEARLTSLGGSLVSSLLMLPQIVALEDLETGLPPEEPNTSSVFLIRPLLPLGMPWQSFCTHVTQAHQQGSAPPPPPPEPLHQTPSPVKSTNLLPLPPPQSLLLQALHGILTSVFVLTNGGRLPADPAVLQEKLRRWPGISVTDVRQTNSRR